MAKRWGCYHCGKIPRNQKKKYRCDLWGPNQWRAGMKPIRVVVCFTCKKELGRWA